MKIFNEHVSHPDLSFRYLRFQNSEAGQWHRHPQIELTWIESGNGVRFIGDSATAFVAGDMVLLGPNLPHLWLSVGDTDEAGLSATVLQLPADFFERTGWPELKQIQHVIDRAALGLQINGKCYQRVCELLATMRHISNLHRLPALLDVFASIHDHLPQLNTIATSRGATDSGTEDNRRIQKVLDWIQANIEGELRVEDAAAIASVTPAAFSRFFRRETGKTYVKYIRAVRCSAACLRLKKTDRPIALIAQECGFANLSNFNRQFLDEVGVTPTQYRNGSAHSR